MNAPKGRPVELAGFLHRFEPGTRADRRPLLLLHGTGGDENDLLPFGRAASPGAALLSPRGQVLESGMARFFRRLAEGVFDEADLCRRTDDLAAFVRAAQAAYGIAAPIALGFSNGANIAAALLFLHPNLLGGAVLLRAMEPLGEPPAARLDGAKALLVSGMQDPIVPAHNSDRLATRLAANGAAITHHRVPGGHGLSHEDLKLVRNWLETTA